MQEYEDIRKLETVRIQSAARNSTEWFEHVQRYTEFEAEQFAYSLLTRSQRVSHENLRVRDKDYLEGYEAWLAEKAGIGRKPVPPMVQTAVFARNTANFSSLKLSCATASISGSVRIILLMRLHLPLRRLSGAGGRCTPTVSATI